MSADFDFLLPYCSGARALIYSVFLIDALPRIFLSDICFDAKQQYQSKTMGSKSISIIMNAQV